MTDEIPAQPALFSDNTPLGAVREIVAGNVRAGIICPCCDQRAQLYWRSLRHADAVAALTLYNVQYLKDPDQFVHLPTILRTRKLETRVAQLSYWGLIEEQLHDEPGRLKRRHLGFWRLTRKGADWVRGVIAVEPYALVYNKEVRELVSFTKNGETRQPVRITDALNAGFDYKAAMTGGDESDDDEDYLWGGV